MKLLPAAIAGLALASMAGCTTPSSNQSNHWRIESIGPRISYHFFGYDGIKDGSGSNFAKQEKDDFMLTIQRHLFGFNPENPLTGSD